MTKTSDHDARLSLQREPSQYDPRSLTWRVLDARTGIELVRGQSRESLYPISARLHVHVQQWTDRAGWETR